MLTPVIILGLLVAPWLVARALSASPSRHQFAGVLGVVFVFCFTGVGHFIKTQQMVAMLPPDLPWRLPAVYISGVVEIVLACLLLKPPLRRPIGWCLVVMLALFLPVNIYAAIERIPMGGHVWGPVYLLIRVPLQLLIIAWVYWFAVLKPS